MPVNSGKYRHRIKVYKNSGERDKYGGMVGTRVLVSKPWCSVRPLADNELVGTTTTDQPMIEIELRYSRMLEDTLGNPTADMFIDFKNSEYDIVSVINHLEINEKLKITAIKR